MSLLHLLPEEKRGKGCCIITVVCIFLTIGIGVGLYFAVFANAKKPTHELCGEGRWFTKGAETAVWNDGRNCDRWKEYLQYDAADLAKVKSTCCYPEEGNR